MTHGRPAWYDVDMRGRRLEALHRRMTTEFYKALDDKNHNLALAYADRINKTESVIHPYVEQMTGVKKLLKKKENENSILV